MTRPKLDSSLVERRLNEHVSRVAARAVVAAVTARAGRFAAAPLPGVTVAAGQDSEGGQARLSLTGAQLRQRYVSDADLRRLIRERLA